MVEGKIANRGFTLIELLVVIAIISILSGLAIFSYYKYTSHAAKVHLVSDVRHCLEYIAINLQEGNTDIAGAVNNCPKSEYTDSIELISENPIQLKATTTILGAEMTCIYNETTGAVDCTSPF